MDQYFDFDLASYSTPNEHAWDDFSCQALADEQEAITNFEQIYKHQNEDRGITRADQPCVYCGSRGLACYYFQFPGQEDGCCSCSALGRACSFTTGKSKNRSPALESVMESQCPCCLEPTRTFEICSACVEEQQTSQVKKANIRFSKAAIRILKDWLALHGNRPYPDEKERTELERRTGLKRSQISNWLANARRRGKVHSVSLSLPGSVDSGNSSHAGIDIPYNQQSPKGTSYQDLNPMERWKVSPPEHEPASVTAIARAVADPSYTLQSRESTGGVTRSRNGSNDSSSFSHFRAPSMNSFDSTPSTTSASDFSSFTAFSHPSSGSFDTRDRKVRRRRRRNPSKPQITGLQANNTRIFECTFCTETFATKYDWQRHEKSLHIPLEKWTCSPNGGIIPDLNTGGTVCTFCNLANPQPAHLDSHNFNVCQENSPEERTFFRKDHLSQHLRLVHNVKLQPLMNTWKTAINHIKSRCGFCSAELPTWAARVEHLAAHFKAGQTMAQWNGDWGFDPSVSRVIENTMPPYLIAYERTTMHPFRGQDMANASHDFYRGDHSSSTHWAEGVNCWIRLENGLKRYVKAQQAQGVEITDEMLQNQGRVVIYGCDDPWNQTGSDNPTWLEAFKRSVGLTPAPPPDLEPSELAHMSLGDQHQFPTRPTRPPVPTFDSSSTSLSVGFDSRRNSDIHCSNGSSLRSSLTHLNCDPVPGMEIMNDFQFSPHQTLPLSLLTTSECAVSVPAPSLEDIDPRFYGLQTPDMTPPSLDEMQQNESSQFNLNQTQPLEFDFSEATAALMSPPISGSFPPLSTSAAITTAPATTMATATGIVPRTTDDGGDLRLNLLYTVMAKKKAKHEEDGLPFEMEE
ncbi:MAG: hypothetical protein M1834_007116 [Cirrosporium novae-zelandiae]|nr:MAG: hypothetical protein M1834_007116 [Cirrosporium novae-zelandiae]